MGVGKNDLKADMFQPRAKIKPPRAQTETLVRCVCGICGQEWSGPDRSTCRQCGEMVKALTSLKKRNAPAYLAFISQLS